MVKKILEILWWITGLVRHILCLFVDIYRFYLLQGGKDLPWFSLE